MVKGHWEKEKEEENASIPEENAPIPRTALETGLLQTRPGSCK
jgi:hypothetical protein